MTQYSIKKSAGRTIIFAESGDYSSQIEVNTTAIDPHKLLELLKTNDVAPEHLRNVYEDLLFQKFML